jgi:hypothetical protein
VATFQSTTEEGCMTERGEVEGENDPSRAPAVEKLELLLSQPEIIAWLSLSKPEIVAWLGERMREDDGDGSARAA